MPRAIENSVIVITGASSGIGQATAFEFARQKATLLLAARRESVLHEVAMECDRLGGTAIAVPTDVTQEDQVQALARRAIETFGRLDVWVNNAAVSLFARFEEAPSDLYRQVIETNLFGYIHGARAAMPLFREQGYGILINVASVVGIAPQPYTSAYTITKFGIRGLSSSLRMELNLDHASNIHVCTVLPATIDTPIFQHAANLTGRKVKAMDPVYAAEDVADTIVGLVKRPQREVVVGAAGYPLIAQATLTPDMFEQTFARQVDENHLEKTPAASTKGNLFEPMMVYNRISGGWRQTGEVFREAVKIARKTAQGLGISV
jgi:short-subunit dehydrogenase